jgi:hypothetical protein
MTAIARDLDAGRPVGSGVEWRVGDRYIMKNSWPVARADVMDAGSSAPVMTDSTSRPKSAAKALWPDLA